MIRDETGDVQVRFELHMTPIDEGLIPQKIDALFSLHLRLRIDHRDLGMSRRQSPNSLDDRAVTLPTPGVRSEASVKK